MRLLVLTLLYGVMEYRSTGVLIVGKRTFLISLRTLLQYSIIPILHVVWLGGAKPQVLDYDPHLFFDSLDVQGIGGERVVS
jgi:hypothetical protein